MNILDEIEKIIPVSPAGCLDWEALETLPVGRFFPDMKSTPQNPEFHGEGDVYTHTKMVCEELVKNPAFYDCSTRIQTELLLAAVLHDIGKIRTTRLEDGKWVSPHHSSTGSFMAREFLWKECGLSGTPDRQQLRETVCMLIRCHMLPVHMLDDANADLRIRETASVGELSPDFSWKQLCILAESDMRGRIAPDIEESLEKIDLCRAMAEEAECLDGPYPFQDAYTKRAYLSGRNVAPNQSLYNDTWGEIILLSGLPGTGKDTWIHTHASYLPVISLDELRKELHIKPTEPQGAVIQEAQKRAKEYLRKHQPFVWNATNIARDMRQKQVSLFERYHASVRIIYLETEWETQLERNEGRKAEVPRAAIERMLSKTVPPLPQEAQFIEWNCV